MREQAPDPAAPPFILHPGARCLRCARSSPFGSPSLCCGMPVIPREFDGDEVVEIHVDRAGEPVALMLEVAVSRELFGLPRVRRLVPWSEVSP